MQERYGWLWDVDLDAAAFDAILAGNSKGSHRDRRWALVRLLEYAPYSEIRRLLPRDFFLAEWPALAPRVKSRTRRDGMDFYYQWHMQRRPTDD